MTTAVGYPQCPAYFDRSHRCSLTKPALDGKEVDAGLEVL